MFQKSNFQTEFVFNSLQTNEGLELVPRSHFLYNFIDEYFSFGL